MKIGFDVSQTGRSKAGCGYWADSLIRQLAKIDTENEYILYPTFGNAYWDANWHTTTCQIEQPNFRRGLGHRTCTAAQLFWSDPSWDHEAQLGYPDIVHANNFFCPKLRQAKLVYTLYDLGFVGRPEWTTEANRIACFAGVFNASLYADRVIAISEYSRRHFLEIFPHYSPERIVVIYPASRFAERTDMVRPRSLAQLQPNEFWLNVGTLEPRKNHRRLLQAYARLKASRDKTFPLVLAGGRGWLMDGFDKLIDELGLRQDAILLDYVDDVTLQWLYRNCFAFVYPSLFEGFGMPVLEAMSLGAAVVTSCVSSLPEITGDAALSVAPDSVDGLAEAMARLQHNSDLRADLQRRALERSALFSWEQTARGVLQIYRTLS